MLTGRWDCHVDGMGMLGNDTSRTYLSTMWQCCMRWQQMSYSFWWAFLFPRLTSWNPFRLLRLFAMYTDIFTHSVEREIEDSRHWLLVVQFCLYVQFYFYQSRKVLWSNTWMKKVLLSNDEDNSTATYLCGREKIQNDLLSVLWYGCVSIILHLLLSLIKKNSFSLYL